MYTKHIFYIKMSLIAQSKKYDGVYLYDASDFTVFPTYFVAAVF